MVLFYHQLAAKLAQNLGASALIYVSEKALSDPYGAPPGVDAAQRIVDGVSIHIPTVVLQETPEVAAIFQGGGLWLKSVSLLQTDLNVLTELIAPWSWYRVAFGLLIGWSLHMIYLIVKGLRDQHAVTKAEQTASSRRVATMRFLILVPELCKNIVAILICIDPLGLFFHFDYFFARIVMNLGAALGTFTNLTMCFFW